MLPGGSEVSGDEDAAQGTARGVPETPSLTRFRGDPVRRGKGNRGHRGDKTDERNRAQGAVARAGRPRSTCRAFAGGGGWAGEQVAGIRTTCWLARSLQHLGASEPSSFQLRDVRALTSRGGGEDRCRRGSWVACGTADFQAAGSPRGPAAPFSGVGVAQVSRSALDAPRRGAYFRAATRQGFVAPRLLATCRAADARPVALRRALGGPLDPTPASCLVRRGVPEERPP